MFKILLVDDEKKITEVIKAYLDKEGYDTFIAYDGQKALELFNQEDFDFKKAFESIMAGEIKGEAAPYKITFITFTACTILLIFP